MPPVQELNRAHKKIVLKEVQNGRRQTYNLGITDEKRFTSLWKKTKLRKRLKQ